MRPPSHVGVRELRQNLSVYLARVKRGESLTVTEHGAVVAELRPATIRGGWMARLVNEGLAVAPTKSLEQLPAPRRLTARRSLSAVLAEDREDRV